MLQGGTTIEIEIMVTKGIAAGMVIITVAITEDTITSISISITTLNPIIRMIHLRPTEIRKRTKTRRAR